MRLLQSPASRCSRAVPSPSQARALQLVAETQRRTSERAAAVAMRPTVAPWPRPPLELLLPPDQQPLAMGGYLRGPQILVTCVLLRPWGLDTARVGWWAGGWVGGGNGMEHAFSGHVRAQSVATSQPLVTVSKGSPACGRRKGVVGLIQRAAAGL